MSEFNIKCQIDQQKLQKEIQTSINERASRIAYQQLSELFCEGRYYGEKKGPMTLLINEQIEDKMLDPTNLEKISKLINTEWDKILEAATIKAMQHKANRIAFATINDRIKAST